MRRVVLMMLVVLLLGMYGSRLLLLLLVLVLLSMMVMVLLVLLHPNLNPLRVDKVVMRVVHTVHCIREELCMRTSRDRRAVDNKQRANEQIASGLDRK